MTIEEQIARADDDIASIRAEIAALHHHKTLLSTSLLSNPRTRQHILQAKQQRHAIQKKNQRTIISPAAIDTALKACDSAALAAHSIGRRSTNGVTAFRVQDPDPHAIDGGRVLGVRFDVVSTRTREFVAPYYVFLVRVQRPTEQVGEEEEEEDVWKVHKHTVPPAVPLGELVRRYMPVVEEMEQDVEGDEDSLSEAEGRQNLDAFVRAVRRELVGMVRRKDALEVIEKEGKKARVIDKFRIVDGVGREVEMETEDGIVIRLMIDMSGEIIEKAVVRSSQGRRRDVERAIVRDEARLDDVLQKLRDAL